LGQPLTLLERLNLSAALDKLNQQAQAKLNAGDRVGAFEIWNRDCGGHWVLEVEALGRVGAIAWNENQKRGANHHWAAAAIQQQLKSNHRLI